MKNVTNRWLLSLWIVVNTSNWTAIVVPSVQKVVRIYQLNSVPFLNFFFRLWVGTIVSGFYVIAQPYLMRSLDFGGDRVRRVLVRLAIFMMPKRVEQRICIKFCVANNINGADTLEMLRKAYLDDCCNQVFLIGIRHSERAVNPSMMNHAPDAPRHQLTKTTSNKSMHWCSKIAEFPSEK